MGKGLIGAPGKGLISPYPFEMLLGQIKAFSGHESEAINPEGLVDLLF